LQKALTRLQTGDPRLLWRSCRTFYSTSIVDTDRTNRVEYLAVRFHKRDLAILAVCLCLPLAVRADDDAAARRAALLHSYGTYAGEIRTPDNHLDHQRLLAELSEMRATTYNYLIAGSADNWDDLQTFLPLAREKGIRVWVTLLPPSESPPRSKRYSEPFRIDYEKWAAELAELSARESALVAWSIDDFAYNVGVYTPEAMKKIIAAQRAKNPKFAFVPCIYYKHATPAFVAQYREFFDGILFPYRSESTTAGFQDAESVMAEVKTLKERFGKDFPIIVDIYATRHSSLGPSTPQYVEQVMKLAYPVADGVHIYRHQNRLDPTQREKFEIVQRVMSSWVILKP